ncbi:unnamed protein product [Closterium sp. NIES-64]|nr:unnamed protein product [Closterium sp. NIES-64]
MSSKAAEPRRSLTAAELAGYSALPVHSFLGLRFLSASPHRVVATLISSPQSAQARRCPALHSPRTPSSRLRFLSASPDRVVATLTSSLSSAQLLSSPPSSTLRYYSPLQISLPPPLAPRLARSLPPAPHLLATRSSPPCHPLLTSFPPPSRLSLLVGVAGVLLTGVAVPCVMVTAFHLLTTPFPSACPFLPTCSSPPFQLLVGGNRWCPLGWRGGAMLLSVSSSLLPTPAHSSPLLPTLPHRFQPLGNLHGGVSALPLGNLHGGVSALPLGNLHGGVSALPLGNLHGGVSALVTEAVGSLGAAVAAGAPVVGVEVACSHLRGAPIGTPLVAVGTPLRVGRTVQVWEVRLSSLSNRAPAQGESAPVSVLTFESIQKGAAPRPSHSQSPDSNAGPSLEPQQQLLPPDCTPEGTPEGFKAGRLLAVGRLTCVPLPQNSGGGANGENGNVGEANGENGNGGGEKGGNGSRGEALRRGESEALGNREEGSGEAEQWIGESTAAGWSKGNRAGTAAGWSKGNRAGTAAGWSKGNRAGTAAGWSKGNRAGTASGWSKGNRAGTAAGWSKGNRADTAAGWSKGNRAGTAAGWSKGNRAGTAAGWSKGNRAGTAAGWSKGNRAGTAAGWSKGNRAALQQPEGEGGGISPVQKVCVGVTLAAAGAMAGLVAGITGAMAGMVAGITGAMAGLVAGITGSMAGLVAGITGSMAGLPFNNVHGGVSAIVTETLGSTGASLAAGGLVVGVEVAVSHLRPCPLGTPVVAVAVPLRAGRTVQVWEVRLSVQKLDKQRRDEQQDVGEASGGTASAPRAGQLLAVGRLTAVVVGKGDGEERRSKARL